MDELDPIRIIHSTDADWNYPLSAELRGNKTIDIGVGGRFTSLSFNDVLELYFWLQKALERIQ